VANKLVTMKEAVKLLTKGDSRPKCPKCGKGMTIGQKAQSGRQRWECVTGKVYCYSTTNPQDGVVRGQDGTQIRTTPKVYKRSLSGSKIFVITAAQNATPMHDAFVENLKKYCEHRDAELLIVPIRYKNATSVWTDSQRNADWWLDAPAPPYDLREDKYRKLSLAKYEAKVYPNRKYLWNVRRRLNENLILCADVKTQPTAVSPLAGWEPITHGESMILAHTKVQLRTVATPQGRLPKIMTTTGACTLPNYTDTATGKRGEFHHTLGAVVVEIRGKTFHMRQINAEKSTGAFYEAHSGDVWYYGADWSGGAPVCVDGEDSAMRPLYLEMGDTHIRGIDPAVERATFQEIIPQLRPRVLGWNDVLDGQSVNHWTEQNPFVSTALSYSRLDNVEEEVQESFRFITERLDGVDSVIIKPSNHHDWLMKWLKFTDWKKIGPKNRAFYLDSASAMVKKASTMHPDDAERLDAYIEFAKLHFVNDSRVKVLDYDESYKVADIEVGMHGHLGPNGSRGTVANYSKLGVKTIAGDCHAPGIMGGAWRAGTSTLLKRGYNRGPSGWLNTHVLVYANGKRTMINVINGSWRL